MPVSLIVIAGLLLDRLLGEPAKFHPLVGFGRLANAVETLLRPPVTAAQVSPVEVRLLGMVGWLMLAALPTVLFGWVLSSLGPWLSALLSLLVLYLCIGARSLEEHARAVAAPLCRGDLATARQQLGRIVSRETANLDEAAVARGTVESVLENGSDALLAPLFWFAVAGAPGALLYRLANTLDAMWGYRNPRYRHFGWAAARLDDLLNWLPARLCAFSYALAGRWKAALRCWRQQARFCESPNAGPVMASGAGALGVRLGGPACYDGVEVMRPTLGEGRAATAADIEAAVRLVRRATAIWVCCIALIEVLWWR